MPDGGDKAPRRGGSGPRGGGRQPRRKDGDGPARGRRKGSHGGRRQPGGPRHTEAFGLAPEIARELDQVAHIGKGVLVKELVSKGAQAYEDEDFAEALGSALRAKQAAPRSAIVRELLGLVYYRLGRWREAARELAAYRRLSARRDQDHVYADCERALGRPERALELLEGLELREVGEEIYIESLLVSAGALVDLGRSEEAVTLLQDGPTHPPEVLERHLRLWYALADALEVAQRRPEARSWWDAVYAEDPDFFDVATRRLGVRSPG